MTERKKSYTSKTKACRLILKRVLKRFTKNNVNIRVREFWNEKWRINDVRTFG